MRCGAIPGELGCGFSKRDQKKNRESGLSEKDLIIACVKSGVNAVKGLSIPEQ
jgi:hypothetical protein